MKGWSAFTKNGGDDKKIQIVLNPGKKEPEMNVVPKRDNSKCAPGQKCIDPWEELENQEKKESSFKKIKVEEAKMAPTASGAKTASGAAEAMTYDKYQEWLAKNPPKKDDKKVTQDTVKSPADQMKDYEKDIQMLLDKGANQDDPRIKSMLDSIKRLKQGKNN